MIEVALRYAQAGVPIFPCQSKPGDELDKSPLVKGGFYAATTDEAKIKRWWQTWPKAMIGMPTGKASGVDVIDLDCNSEKNKDGKRTVPDWRDRSPLIAETPSGGAHLFFAVSGLRNSTEEIGSGVDVRGEGGYIIAPGSVRDDGKSYQWLKGGPELIASLPPFPDDLRSRLRREDYSSRTPSEDAEADPKLVAAALAVIPNDDMDWENWNRIGMATWAATGGSDEGLKAFDEWSSKSKKYNAMVTKRRWQHFFRSPPSQIGAGSLFFEATEASPDWANAYYDAMAEALNAPSEEFEKQFQKASSAKKPKQKKAKPKRRRTTKPEPETEAAAEPETEQPKAGPPPKRRIFYTAAELQQIEFPPLKFVVEGYIVDSCLSLLAGKPKIGKSWLCLDICLAVASGGTALGQIKCEEGDVLYAALEDNARRLKGRIAKILQSRHDIVWPERLKFMLEMSRLDQGGIKELRTWITQAKNPRLIAIDIFTRVIAPPGHIGSA